MTGSRQPPLPAASRSPRTGPVDAHLQRLCRECTDAFTAVVRELPTKERKKWQRARGRLQLWATALSSPLDSALADPVDVALKESVQILLCSLADSLAQLSPLPVRRKLAASIVHAQSAVPEIAGFIDVAALLEEQDPPAPHDALEDITYTLDSLFDLVPFLDEAIATATRQPDETPAIPSALPAGALWYRNNIRDKYPDIALSLAATLSSLNWTRHERIRAWKDAHQQAVAHPESPASDDEAHEYASHAGTSHSGVTGTSWATKLSALSSVFSRGGRQNSWGSASDASSATTFVSSVAGSDDEAQRGRWPEPPVDLHPDVAPFTCSVCFQTLTNVTNRAEWKKHILHDLQPYSCLDPACRQKATTFSSRKDWISHEFSEHRYVSFFVCVSACGRSFLDRQSFESHLLSEHLRGMGATRAEIQDMVQLQERRKPAVGMKTQCPFCTEEMEETRNTVMRHIGRHFEEVALKTLPAEVFEKRGHGEYDDSDEEEPGPSFLTYPEENPLGLSNEADAEEYLRVGRPATPPPPQSLLRRQSSRVSEQDSMNSSTSSLSPHDHAHRGRPARTYSDVVKPRPPQESHNWPPLSPSPEPSLRRVRTSSASPRPPDLGKEDSEIGVTGTLEKYVGKSVREGDRKGSRESRHHPLAGSGSSSGGVPMSRGGSGRSRSGEGESKGAGGEAKKLWKRAGEKFKGAEEGEGAREVYGSP